MSNIRIYDPFGGGTAIPVDPFGYTFGKTERYFNQVGGDPTVIQNYENQILRIQADIAQKEADLKEAQANYNKWEALRIRAFSCATARKRSTRQECINTPFRGYALSEYINPQAINLAEKIGKFAIQAAANSTKYRNQVHAIKTQLSALQKDLDKVSKEKEDYIKAASEAAGARAGAAVQVGKKWMMYAGIGLLLVGGILFLFRRRRT